MVRYITLKEEHTLNSVFGKLMVGYRYGKAPESGYSHNYRDNKSENGVSMASVGQMEEKGSFAISNLKDKGVKKFYYKGTISGTGGDDEILLSNIEEITYKEYKKELKNPNIIATVNKVVNLLYNRRLSLIKAGYNLAITIEELNKWKKDNLL